MYIAADSESSYIKEEGCIDTDHFEHDKVYWGAIQQSMKIKCYAYVYLRIIFLGCKVVNADGSSDTVPQKYGMLTS